MSAQLLICKFAVVTCVSLFFFTDASRDSHGSLARSLSRPFSGSRIFSLTATAEIYFRFALPAGILFSKRNKNRA